MSIVVRAISRENQPPKSEVEGCSLLTFKQPIIIFAMAVPENTDEMAIFVAGSARWDEGAAPAKYRYHGTEPSSNERLQTVEEQVSIRYLKLATRPGGGRELQCLYTLE